MEWDCRVQDENVILCILRSTPRTLAQYPFEFELTLSYTLHESTLYVEYSLMNLSTELPLFASLGAHPAFALSAPISEYSLRFPQDEELMIDRLEL